MSPKLKLEIRKARDAWLYARTRRSELEESLGSIEAELEDEIGTEREWSCRRRHSAMLERIEHAAQVEWEAKRLLVRALESAGAFESLRPSQPADGEEASQRPAAQPIQAAAG